MHKEICKKFFKTTEIAVKKSGRPCRCTSSKYKSFFSLVQHKFFLARTTPNFEDLLKECKISINNELLPNLLKKSRVQSKIQENLVSDRGGWPEHP